jgi:biopolymer transport protein ExbD
MAGINIGGSGHASKRTLDHQIPLIPFIDFLLCLVSFLLITAVWSQMARIEADARVPGPATGPETKVRQLHVEMKGARGFQLVWKEGNQVLETIDVPRAPVQLGGDELAYPELARHVGEQWARYEGRHYTAGDPVRDQAVLHTDNSTKFAEVVAVIDAVQSQRRPLRDAANTERQVPAFNVVFAVN